MDLSNVKISLEDLAKFSAEYDEEHGCYPERAWEGKAYFESLYKSLFEKEIPESVNQKYFNYTDGF